MTNYAVVCDCDGSPQARIILLIDDDRATGGHLHVESNDTTIKRGTISHRGGTVNTFMRCAGPCGRELDLSDVTVLKLLDLVNIEALPPTTFTTYAPTGDAEAVAAWRAERHEAALAELTGNPSPPTSSVGPFTATAEERYAIPFSVVCHKISQFKKDR